MCRMSRWPENAFSRLLGWRLCCYLSWCHHSFNRLNAVQAQSAQTVVAATAASCTFAVALLPPDTPCRWRFVEADTSGFIFNDEKPGVSFCLFHRWGTNAEILLSSVFACRGLKRQRFQAMFRLVNILAWLFGNINPLKLHGYPMPIEHLAVHGMDTACHHQVVTKRTQHGECLF